MVKNPPYKTGATASIPGSESQAGIKIARRNINNLRYADDTMLMAEREEIRSLLIKVREESENTGLKLSIQKRRSWHPVPSLHGK